jgi:hypothetical protein
MQEIEAGIGLSGKDVDNVLQDYGDFYRRGRTSRKSSVKRIKYKRIPHINKDERHTVSFLTRNRKFHGALAVLEEDRLSEPELPLARKSMDEVGAGSEDFDLLSIEAVQSPKRSLERFSPQVPPEFPQKVKTLSGSDWRAKFDKTAHERLARRRKVNRHRTQSMGAVCSVYTSEQSAVSAATIEALIRKTILSSKTFPQAYEGKTVARQQMSK